MEKCGLKVEGEFKDEEFLKGRYITLIQRAIVPSDAIALEIFPVQ